ncbi:oxygen-binding di-iron domain-containing protein [Adhaeribacter radiodurans]|uniref:MBL fold metallo-hydrolase n=1 Tax=Adhaeribacter radiodurans TaxID=2745197 RepID=A0A7L7LAL5_9BACT|nr:MBL fold metallo-hydrolase [Adhaeribacter radiodurans]QMU29754.1 MBL fold metallo-hydrolase [Adhaeribacter radiodurans]
MIKVSEIAPDVYRISVFVPDFNLQFNHFLIKDEEPMLYHAGMRQMFPALLEAVSKIISPSQIRWIGFSHFEVDECGALNEWLQAAPDAKAVCSEAGAIVNMSDFAIRPAFAMAGNAVLNTGKYNYRFIRTPHLPHGWDAGVMFEETNRTLLCSDLFHQNGNVADITDKDILSSHRNSMLEFEQGPLMEYTPYTHHTAKLLYSLSDLKPKTLATMHGSSFYGDCSQALIDLNSVMKEIWGGEAK